MTKATIRVTFGAPARAWTLARRRPVDDGGRRLIDAVVVHILDHADDFLPGAVGSV